MRTIHLNPLLHRRPTEAARLDTREVVALQWSKIAVKISVVVPAFNEEKLIAGTLRSIRAASRSFIEAGWETELVVCDNNSTDRTAELARAEGATVVFEPINQIGRARNAGAAAATGDWLIFIDADSQPSAGLFASVAREIRRGGVIAGGSTVRIEGGCRVASLVTRGWNLLSRLKRWAAGSFIFCESAAFREIGGFSRELFASEELDLSERLKRLGRSTGRRFVILHEHPLVTSARKLHLYTPWEHLRFLAKTVLVGGRTLKSREECLTWYDGRR
jgi:glycosyltransferase involved in cell wall biosynthesis